MRVTAVVPTLNEERTVGEVVQGCLAFVDDVLVVDGVSADGTCEAAVSCGARVVRLGRRGKGRAVRHAIAVEDADVLVFVDADGSHCLADIPLLLEPILRGKADLVIASRVTGGSDELDGDSRHLLRALGTRGLQALVNRCLGVELTDIQNGFRAIRTIVARELDLHEAGFCVEQEMAIRCLCRRYRVANVPSHEFPRRHGRSRLRLWALWPKFLWSIGVLLLEAAGSRHDSRRVVPSRRKRPV